MNSEKRPWGTFEILTEEKDYKLKRIEVFPGQRLSYQSHKFRSENWIVVHGVAAVRLNDEMFNLKVGDSIFIPCGAKHRLQNNGINTLTIIEVQTGSYFGEDDIVRYEDDYNRK